MNFWHPQHKHHHNLLLFIFGLTLAIIISQNAEFNKIIGSLGTFGYLGAVIAGGLFTSTFTVAIGAVILVDLAKTLPPVWLILFAAAGAVFSDFLIFKFIKDEVEDDIKPIYEKIVGSHLKKILHTKYFAWTLPVLGALIIVSPIPDELGVSLMGFSTLTTTRFLTISLVSHLIGISALVSAAKIF